MKTTLEFNCPEDNAEMLRAVHASDAWYLLFELDRELRNIVKHGTSHKTPESLASEIRETIREVLQKVES